MNVFITVGGEGTRLKAISSVDKHLLYYRDKRIIEHTLSIFPNAKIIGQTKTNSRVETLNEIINESNALILDCDIIPIYDWHTIDLTENTIFAFTSSKNKYGSLIVNNRRVVECSETDNISNIKCSGAYFVQSVGDLISKMQSQNSIASGMIDAKVLIEKSFIRVGDVEDYLSAL